MKNKYYQNNIIEESKRAILKKYSEDIRLDYSFGGHEEWWIGEKGTTTLKVLLWDDCKQDEGEGFLTDYGFDVKFLRSDTHFIGKCLSDGDVNHALKELPCNYGEEEMLYKLENEYAKDLFSWYLGTTNRIPITPCGMENYSEYINYPD